MDKKIVYEDRETRYDDGSREVEKHATTGSGFEGYGENDELKLFINEDPGESITEYGVSWRDLCGYFVVSFHTATEEDAVKLFEALQKVTGYNVS